MVWSLWHTRVSTRESSFQLYLKKKHLQLEIMLLPMKIAIDIVLLPIPSLNVHSTSILRPVSWLQGRLANRKERSFPACRCVTASSTDQMLAKEPSGWSQEFYFLLFWGKLVAHVNRAFWFGFPGSVSVLSLIINEAIEISFMTTTPIWSQIGRGKF